MKDHPEMTIDVIKQLPELLYDPILVFDSNTVKIGWFFSARFKQEKNL